jgi:hypothetical protein
MTGDKSHGGKGLPSPHLLIHDLRLLHHDLAVREHGVDVGEVVPGLRVQGVSVDLEQLYLQKIKK